MPVALNLYKIRAAKDAAGDFFRSVYKESGQYQGLLLASPEGKLLAGHQGSVATQAEWYTAWPKKVLADLQAGMKAFGEIKPRKVGPTASLPFRGFAVQADGSVTLAVTDKGVHVQDLGKDIPADAIGATILDSLTLPAADWSSLAPPQTSAERKWTVPEATARRFFPLLSTNDSTFRNPKEVTAVRLVGKVESVQDGIAYLTFEGNIAATHQSEGKEGKRCSAEAKLIGGAGAYDIQAKKLLSLTLVWDGFFRNYPPYDDPPSRFGAVVEWRRDRSDR